jgi:1-acyl-sn-glycerol-3-phosphate acyltransferase
MPHKMELLKKRVLDSAHVRRTILELARIQSGPFRLWRLNRLSRNIIDAMAADVNSKGMVMAAFCVVHAMLNRLYHQGIHVKENDIYELRQTALKAEAQGIPLIFLPCHRSHMDYIVLSYIFLKLGISLPFIAAGNNLDLPLVGNILRREGAFFIKRKFDKDPLYAAIFKEYIECLLEDGINLEVFIEGTRSRTGKLLNPKFGVLKVIIEALLRGRISDVYFIPISIGYDKVIETSSYVDELMGRPKEAESLSGIMASTKLLQLKLGRIDIRFASSFSLKRYILEQTQSRSDFDPYQKHDSFLLLLRSIGYRICSDMNRVAVIMPTALVGTILLSLNGRGIGKDEVRGFMSL